MNPRATYLAKGPEVNGHASMQLRAAALLTLETPHSCGSNEVYLTPESLGIPNESFRRALGEVQDLIDQKVPLLLTLSACERKRAFFKKVRPCTSEECVDLMTPLVDGKLYLDEHFAPVGRVRASYYLKMPMTYDGKLQAWNAQIFYQDSQALRSDYFVDNEDFVSGKPVHTYKSYYQNGKLRKSYRNDASGQLQGEAMMYAENGTVIKRENYLNNELEGTQSIYHDNGKLAESYKWHLGKRVDGEYPKYDENGALIGRTSYRNNVWDGPSLGYFPNGKLRYSTLFVNGKSEGPTTYYFEDGTKQFTRNDVNGKPVGWMVTYFIDGKVKEKEFYKDGNRLSYEQWTQQGVQTLQWQWDAQNRKQGDFKRWYESGQLKEHQKYQDDKLQGSSATWHENGEMASSAGYVDGKEHGPIHFWRDNGSLSYECQYLMGKKLEKCTYISAKEDKSKK
ncbi:hypothetical protein CP336_08715 [Pseudomonas fluorescens]|nr:hypothetical protein CP336_08715 [Pseudomonas fluorescens]